MKPDGVNMETTEPTEAAAVAESSSSLANITEQAPSQPEEAANDAPPRAVAKVSGKPVAANPKVNPKTKHPTSKTEGASASTSRPGTASHRTVNDVKSANNAPAKTAAVKKTTATTKTASASTSGAIPRRPVGTAAAVPSTARNQTKVPNKKPVGSARTTSAAATTATNGTRSTTVNGAATKTVNVARPKPTATTSRPAVSPGPKSGTSTGAKADGAAVLKTTRPAAAPSTSRLASRPTTTTTKPPTTAKTAASRITTVPSTGKTTVAQPPKTQAVKKDVSRPSTATAAKKPTATSSAASKRPEPSKPTAAVKLNTASKWSTTKAAEPKTSQSKTQAAKPSGINKPVGQFPALNKPPIGRTPPASPASNKPVNNTPQAKRGQKPMQAVSPFTASKKTAVSSGAAAAASVSSGAAGAVTVAAMVAAATAEAVPDTQAEANVALPQGSSLAASVPEKDSPTVLAQGTQPEVVQQETAESYAAALSPPQSPVRTALPLQEHQEGSVHSLPTQEQISTPAEPSLPPVASPPQPSEEPFYLVTDQAPSTSKAPIAAENVIPQMAPPTNLNEEEEDEEEREGSQLVSVSEMSGTTQPTEESRPGSAGPVGGSAWRVGGALLSELDSEEVSVSQQGASELSAPGVLEGTESMDDLGDGSLKGAIDMEGASAGSPDFEKVPDIPVNDYEEDEDDEDDDDRVCDMDVGSERTDEPQRTRDDNDVDDDDEDEDVEMASEGVTESGLESYGNADEDDFAEDERLDNLNRVAQPPPPPPQLPSAPAAQWDQPNPFADPWAEPPQPLQVLDQHVSEPRHVAGAAAAASPLADPWQADSETPTHSPAQAWLELGTAPFVPENQEAPQPSSDKDHLQSLEAQMYMEQPGPASVRQTTTVAPPSAPGMSLSSTLSSETSTPEELNDNSRDGNLQPQDVKDPQLSPQLDVDHQNLDREREEDAEAETLPADEIVGGPATAPTSNPTSSSVTEDEASDTEGEAQLEESLESPGVSNVVFDIQPSAKRCLSTVEEGLEMEEGESGVAEDTTPPSATSQASYGFDTMTTASNSNAQSTGESCIKSPGIFSLEELPEEAKESGLLQQPLSQPCQAEQQYIECGKREEDSAEHSGEKVPESEEAIDPSSVLVTLQQAEENPDDVQPPYYSGICEKTENSFAGFTDLPHPHRREHSAYPRSYCDIVKPLCAAATPPKLTCADLPPRSPGQQALSPQLRRLEQHQRQLQEMQQRREQQNRPLEEAEQERKRRQEEEQRKKKEEAEEEIKRNKEEESRKVQEQAEVAQKEEEELKQRRDLELQLHQQQQELKQRQQIMQWQQELQQSSKGQTVLLSPSSGLCTIYEALENSDEEDAEEEEKEGIKELKPVKQKKQLRHEMPDQKLDTNCERGTPEKDKHPESSPSAQSPSPLPDSPQTPSNLSQDGDGSSPERPPPLELDWGKKVDIVHQLINQTLLLNGDSCSSLLLLPGGAGGTLSPLESSLWPSLLPPLTPPSATVTSVSSFSPETTGSSPQGEWTVVELETHH